MMKIYLSLISFVLCYYLTESVQPYFPPQIVFTDDTGLIVVVDEVNQRAYQRLNYTSSEHVISFAYQHFPFADPDTPESKHYVQLVLQSPGLSDCQYATYWKYGGDYFNQFPIHWWSNSSSFQIKNYVQFDFQMIHSKNSSEDLDYWYANTNCETESKEVFPCQEIYFKKNTQIPVRYTEVVRHGMQVMQEITNYQVISIGKPDDKYFDSIPKNWSVVCQDVNLGLLYNPQSITIDLHQSVKVQIWLSAPPHRINGNDTVTVQWKTSECTDCFTWIPKQFSFNGENFQKKQVLTITRTKKGPLIHFTPIFNGGGFDLVSADDYTLIIA